MKQQHRKYLFQAMLINDMHIYIQACNDDEFVAIYQLISLLWHYLLGPLKIIGFLSSLCVCLWNCAVLIIFVDFDMKKPIIHVL